MAQTFRILGQKAPGAGLMVTLYTVPTNTESRVVRMFAANRNSGASVVRIALNVNGASATSMSYIYYDKSITGNDTLEIEELRMGPNDSIWVYSDNGNVAFSAFGEELALS